MKSAIFHVFDQPLNDRGAEAQEVCIKS